jgi:hypothetical protein
MVNRFFKKSYKININALILKLKYLIKQTTMDVNKLLKALNNESNEQLFNFTTNTIIETNKNILKELNLSKKDTLELVDKLRNYKYVDEMNDLKCGTYLRWINVDNPNSIVLSKGAVFCELKITNEGVFLICKNYGFKSRHFQISLDKHLIFQKLTEQELVLLSALDHLSK